MLLYQAPEAPKIRRRSVGSTNQTRVDQVFEELWESSLPPNPVALARIQSLLKNNKIDSSAISNEIISDPGLALYYLKKIRSFTDPASSFADPLSLLSKLDLSALVEIFNKPASSISKYNLNKATPAQLLRLQHTYISSKASINLSRQLSLAIGETFAINQISQSNLNLLAWQYPSQFQRALLQKRRYRADISESLKNMIGIDPKALNSKLIKALGMPIKLLQDLEQVQHFQKFKSIIRPEIVSVIQAGELLARANDIEHYPEALGQWSQVEEEIERLGLESPRIEIEQEIKAFMSELGVDSNLPYKSALFPLEEMKTDLNQVSSDSNPYIRRLPEKLQSDFRSIYKVINKDAFSVAGLKFLVEKIADSLNIYSGYLYLLKTDDQTLSVSLNFGQHKYNHKELQLSSNNPIAQSIFSQMPLTIELDNNLMLLCCSLQNSRKQAVLGLEWQQQDYVRISGFATELIRAFAYTLVDIMGQRKSP